MKLDRIPKAIVRQDDLEMGFHLSSEMIQLFMKPFHLRRVGLAGVARGWPHAWLGAVVGVALGSAARLLAHVLSGVVYFAHLAPPDTPVWVYSLAYNGSYMVPEAAISAVAVALVYPRLARARSAPG